MDVDERSYSWISFGNENVFLVGSKAPAHNEQGAPSLRSCGTIPHPHGSVQASHQFSENTRKAKGGGCETTST